MVVKTMPVDAAAGKSGSVRERPSGKSGGQNGGFSDVLGSVGGEGRKQPGLSGSSGNASANGKELGGFRYSQKASESIHDGGGDLAYTGTKAAVTENGAVIDENAADKLLSQAAEMVTRTVRETGKAPAKEQAAVMLTDALRDIGEAYKADIAADEQAVESDDTTALIDALIQAVTTVSEGSENTEQTAEALRESVLTDEEKPTDAKVRFTQRPHAKTAEMPEEDAADKTSVPAEKTDTDFTAQLIQLAAPDIESSVGAGQAVLPEDVTYIEDTVAGIKSEKAAPRYIPRDIPVKATEDDIAAFEELPAEALKESAANIANETAADTTGYIPEEMPKDIPLDIPTFEDVMAAKNADNAEIQPAAEFNEARDLPKGYSVIKEVFASPERGLPVSAVPEMPVADEETAETDAVNDTLKMLGELIRNAKKELGLTEVRISYTEGDEPEEIPQIMPNEHVKLSRQMNGTDRTRELDNILNESREDVSGKEAPKTETYDAVRMSEQLLGSRTESRMPVEFRDEAEVIARPPEVQLTEQILGRLEEMQTQKKDSTEFTMVLNPESLGRITVKLVMTGEKTAVEISAENPDTRALLASRSEALQNMLKDNGVQLERYQVVSEREDARFYQQSYDGSSKNPYGRNDDGQKQDGGDNDDDSFYDLLQSI